MNAPRAEPARPAPRGGASRPAEPDRLRVAPTLHCVAGDAPEETCALLRDACRRLQVHWRRLGPEAGEAAPEPVPVRGDLLFQAGTDAGSRETAERLWRPGVLSLQGIGQAARTVGTAELAAEGVRLPLRIAPAPRGGAALADAARKLGAWPLLLRLNGGEGGHGVMRIDSLPSLVSVRDVMPDDAALVEYVPHAVAWRVVIVGGEVVAAEAWRASPEDFRSNVGGRLDESRPRPAEVDRMALAAARLLGLEFAGVDVMEGEAGAVCVAEVNSPCFFVDTQRRSGVDIAARIVERLLALRAAG